MGTKVERLKLIYGFEEDIKPFQFNEEIIECLEEIRSSIRRSQGKEIPDALMVFSDNSPVNLGKRFLQEKFKLQKVSVIFDADTPKLVTYLNDKEKYSKMCRWVSHRVNPYDIPIQYVDYERLGLHIAYIDNMDRMFHSSIVKVDELSEDIKYLKKCQVYFNKILLTHYNTVLNSSNYVHEIVHTQTEKRGVIKDPLNGEVLSIFLELLQLYELDGGNVMTYMGIIFRSRALLESYGYLKYDNRKETLTDDELLNNLNSSKYIFSTLKAFDLFFKYVNGSYMSKELMVQSIQEVFDGKRTVEDFLEIFNVDIKNGTQELILNI